MGKNIQINDSDNVAVALEQLSANDIVKSGGKELKLQENVALGHKFALADIAQGEKVIKYGFPIGVAIKDIRAGEWVHTHNMKTGLSEETDYVYSPDFKPLEDIEPACFQGYLRADGRAAVRNELWIIPTVGCVNDVCKKLEQEYSQNAVDGIYAFIHPYGCSQMGDDHETTKKLLAALVHHPNAGGVLIVGLGCENNRVEDFKKELGDIDETRVKFMVCQDEEDELVKGRELIDQLLKVMEQDSRQPLPASKLVVGMKCGGSDGLSGITGNVIVGKFSDKLISMGGSTILTEVPEMFGAESILLNRSINKEVFDKASNMISDFKDYFTRQGQVVYENPSPGNKDGGITTLEDKSLGCVQKGGKAPVSDVLSYGDRIKVQGLTLLYGPGNDLVSTTAMTAAGAHIILFTTGRGTPFGAPAVTLKISTNSELAKRKPNWIDFDTGTLLEGRTAQELTDSLTETVLKVASGEIKSRAEENGYREIAIFKNGVTL